MDKNKANIFLNKNLKIYKQTAIKKYNEIKKSEQIAPFTLRKVYPKSKR